VSWSVLLRARMAAVLVSAMSKRVDAGTMAAAWGTAVSWARMAAALMSAGSTSVDAGTMAAVGGASAALLSIGSMGVEAGTVAAAEAVTCMLTMALATCPTLSSRDGGPVLCEHVHVSLRESELDVRRVVTLLS
jgi:glutamate 5-kinase